MVEEFQQRVLSKQLLQLISANHFSYSVSFETDTTDYDLTDQFCSSLVIHILVNDTYWENK